MTATTISAKRKEDTSAIEAQYDFGDNLGEATEKFGADVVYAKFKQSAIIDVQSVMRRWLAGDPAKRGDLQATVSAYKPDNRVVVKKSVEEKAKEAIDAMTPEQRRELLKHLRALGAGTGASA
jgi:hypothetical protein